MSPFSPPLSVFSSSFTLCSSFHHLISFYNLLLHLFFFIIISSPFFSLHIYFLHLSYFPFLNFLLPRLIFSISLTLISTFPFVPISFSLPFTSNFPLVSISVSSYFFLFSSFPSSPFLSFCHYLCVSLHSSALCSEFPYFLYFFSSFLFSMHASISILPLPSSSLSAPPSPPPRITP